MNTTPLAQHSQKIRRERTHTRIKNSMLQLMGKKAFDEITITELSREAHINRKTFYSHFDSTDAVLTELEDDFVERVFALYQPEHSLDYLSSPRWFFQVLLEELNHNQRDLLMLIQTDRFNRLFVKIKNQIILLFTRAIDEADMEIDREQFLYLSEFMAGGIMAVLEKWAAGYGETPFRTVADTVLRMLEYANIQPDAYLFPPYPES